VQSGLIDEDEFLVLLDRAGRGPTLVGVSSKRFDLKLMSRAEFGSGAAAIRYAGCR
jgi:hypothetical protein